MSLHTQQARPIAIGRKPFAISVRNSAWDHLPEPIISSMRSARSTSRQSSDPVFHCRSSNHWFAAARTPLCLTHVRRSRTPSPPTTARLIKNSPLRLNANERKCSNRFPLEQWPTMPLERYALGQKESEETFCRWMEFRTQHLGSMQGGSARKHIIYKHKDKPGWYFDPSTKTSRRRGSKSARHSSRRSMTRVSMIGTPSTI